MRAPDRLARMAEEDRQNQDRILAEFGDDPRAMADEILRLRHGLARLAEAISLMQQGAPFAMIRPGPYGKPKAEQDDGRRR